jgi:ABC-type transport system involved in cytochrome c biogenesis ATPase subunit
MVRSEAQETLPGLMGRNGMGKATLLGLGLVRPRAGAMT